MSDKELFYRNLALFSKPEEAKVFFDLVGNVIEKYNLSFLDERLNLSVAESGQFRFTLKIGDKKVLEVKRSHWGVELFFLLPREKLSVYQAKDYDYLNHTFFKSKRDQSLVFVSFDLATYKANKYKLMLNDWTDCLETLFEKKAKQSTEDHNLYFYRVITHTEELEEVFERGEIGQNTFSFDREIEIEEVDVRYKFDPLSVDIGTEQKSLDILINRIKYDEINLLPDFQRSPDLWSDRTMSLLIESILLNLPLPAFYFDGSNPDKWIVVDGLQRLSTLQKFVVFADKHHAPDKYKNRLILKNLETLPEINGKDYNELPSRMKRRISEFTVTLYRIKPGTSKNVKYSIFHRINTGGLNLNAQEIRNALNQDSDAPEFLKLLSGNESFRLIVNISSKRMQDRELILRFMAYQILEPDDYRGSMSQFLDLAMEKLGEVEVGEKYKLLEQKFIQSLLIAQKVFGEHVFSKSIRSGNNSFNRTLYEVWTYYFSFIDESQEQCLLENKESFIKDFQELLTQTEFDDAITFASASTTKVLYRFEKVAELIQKYIPDFNYLWQKNND